MKEIKTDAYFSADVETDGAIPGPFSMLSFAIVYAGHFDGTVFQRPESYTQTCYTEMCPISNEFDTEAMEVNGLDRNRLINEGVKPVDAMTEAAKWVRKIAGSAVPILVAYPLSFNWLWLYWYFVRFSREGSPFSYSGCYDVKTAFAVKSGRPVTQSGRSSLCTELQSKRVHTHHALDDAKEQAEIFANIFEWNHVK